MGMYVRVLVGVDMGRPCWADPRLNAGQERTLMEDQAVSPHRGEREKGEDINIKLSSMDINRQGNDLNVLQGVTPLIDVAITSVEQPIPTPVLDGTGLGSPLGPEVGARGTPARAGESLGPRTRRLGGSEPAPPGAVEPGDGWAQHIASQHLRGARGQCFP